MRGVVVALCELERNVEFRCDELTAVKQVEELVNNGMSEGNAVGISVRISLTKKERSRQYIASTLSLSLSFLVRK